MIVFISTIIIIINSQSKTYSLARGGMIVTFKMDRQRPSNSNYLNNVTFCLVAIFRHKLYCIDHCTLSSLKVESTYPLLHCNIILNVRNMLILILKL